MSKIIDVKQDIEIQTNINIFTTLSYNYRNVVNLSNIGLHLLMPPEQVQPTNTSRLSYTPPIKITTEMKLRNFELLQNQKFNSSDDSRDIRNARFDVFSFINTTNFNFSDKFEINHSYIPFSSKDLFIHDVVVGYMIYYSDKKIKIKLLSLPLMNLFIIFGRRAGIMIVKGNLFFIPCHISRSIFMFIMLDFIGL